MGARRDLVAELTAALRERGLKAGIFLELAEAANPLCPASGMETGSITWNVPPGSCKAAYSSYLQTQLREAIERFEPDLVYLDVRPPARRVPGPALAFWQLLPPLGGLPARATVRGDPLSGSPATRAPRPPTPADCQWHALTALNARGVTGQLGEGDPKLERLV